MLTFSRLPGRFSLAFPGLRQPAWNAPNTSIGKVSRIRRLRRRAWPCKLRGTIWMWSGRLTAFLRGHLLHWARRLTLRVNRRGLTPILTLESFPDLRREFTGAFRALASP